MRFPNNNVPYSDAELKYAVDCYINKNLTMEEAAFELNKKFWNGKRVRSQLGLERKFYKLSIHKRGPRSDYERGIVSPDTYKIMELLKAGKSAAEVARIINVPIGTIKSKLNYIRHRSASAHGKLLKDTFPLADKIYSYLKIDNQVNKEQSLIDLSNKFDTSPNRIQDAIEELRDRKYNIILSDKTGGFTLSDELTKSEESHVDSKKFFKTSGKVIRFGAIGDSHLGSKYARLDCLNTMYDIYEKEGINKVFLCGNIVDGECHFNRFDLLAHGIEGQLLYCVKNFPKRKGIETHFITADDHEGWWVKDAHVNVGELLENIAVDREKRTDLKYIGHMEKDIILGDAKQPQVLRLTHPGGGSSYATSYKSQKYAESLQGGTKPRIVLIGHYHKFNFDYPREIYSIQVGCFQDQTPFLRKQNIQAHLGGCIIEIHINDDNVIDRCKCEFVSFFDKSYYEYKW